MNPVLQNETVHPKGTVLHGVRQGGAEDRPWMSGFLTSPSLGPHQILHCGVAFAPPGYRIARVRQAGMHFVVPLDGEGRVWMAQGWENCGPGSAVVFPANISLRFETSGRTPWKFAWVCYREQPRQGPMAAVTAPRMGEFQGGPLEMAIEGLRAECRGGASAALEHYWAELIQRYAERFAEPLGEVDPFGSLWQQVEANLAGRWTVESLAQGAGCNREKLRVLCTQAFGRPPMHQLAYLRMRRAAQLLVTRDEKLESVAQSVGYSNPFVFSNAFLKWTGCRPSEYRERERR